MSDQKTRAVLELPEWVDEEIFTAFLLSLQDSLDEIEATTFALGDAPAEKLDAIKRVVHTLKGEAYVVGIDELGDATHELENHLEAQKSPLDCEEGLLCLVDWARKALESLKARLRPEPIGDDFFGDGNAVVREREEEVILLDDNLKKQEESSRQEEGVSISDIDAATVDIDAEAEEKVRQALALAEAAAEEKIRLALVDDEKSDSEAASCETAAASKTAASKAVAGQEVAQQQEAAEAKKQRVSSAVDPAPHEIVELKAAPFDPEMHEIVEEFTQESEESLSIARELLTKGESSGCVEHDDVNALFRVFHTIKGVAGFLDLKEIQELAHVTESVLIPCRDDGQPLSGDLLSLISDATYVMADLSDDVKGVLCGQRDSYRIGVGVLFRLKQALEILESSPGVAENESKPDGSKPDESKPEKAKENSTLTAAPEKSAGKKVQTLAKPIDDVVTGEKSAQTSRASASPSQTDGAKAASGSKTGTGRNKEVIDVETKVKAVRGKAAKLRETVKVDLDRVDSLVEMIGELVIIQSMLAHDAEVMGLSRDGHRRMDQLAKISRDLQDMGMNMRMVPVRGVFQKMERMIRDLSRKSGKQVRVVQIGANTEIDRSMVERLGDPLVHMIRNAMDHGIEDAEERGLTDKDSVATVELSAFYQGNRIVIELRDDGRGLDPQKIRRKAISKGILQQEDVLSDSELHNLIFHAGFSTAEKVTELSGRGVGMDVVKKNIESMRGSIVVESELGKGTTFQLVLPLTLAIIDGMIVRVGEERFILPTLSIVESVRPQAEDVRTLAGECELLSLREELIQLVHLADILDIEGAASTASDGLVVVMEAGARKIGVIIDDVLAQQQVVIKSLGPDFANATHLAGAAILSDGVVGLILSPEGLMELQDASVEPRSKSCFTSSAPLAIELGA